MWHQRLGHPSNGVYDLLPVVSKRVKDFSVCSTCMKAKQSRVVFHSSENKRDDIFEMIHCDLWGPYRTASLCNSFYFLTIVDDYSRGVWVYLLRNKTQVGETIRNFMTLIKRQFNKEVKVVRSDNGTEFTSLTKEFRELGIIHQTSCVGTPQQNGRVERKHRHILNVARSLLFQSSLPIKFWGESVLTAAYLINRTPSRVLNGKTPFELIYGKPPAYDELKVFGCLAFAHKQRRDGDKFDARSRKCIFVGYPFGKKGWNLYDLDTKEMFVSRDVVFVENTFPFASEMRDKQYDFGDFGFLDEEDVDNTKLGRVIEPVVKKTGEELPSENLEALITKDIMEIVTNAATEEAVGKMVDDGIVDTTPALHDDAVIVVGDDTSSGDDENVLESDESNDNDSDDEKLGCGMRQKWLPVKLHDYALHTVKDHAKWDVILSDKSEYPLSDYLDSSKFSAKYRSFLAAITAETEPTTFRQAVAEERWRKAMQHEIDALEKNKTWELTTLPVGKKVIGCKWVFKIKYRADGTIERFKARLVVLGNRQKEGVDYKETFAPVVRMSTVRTFLSVAAAREWELTQMDVHNAFLHGDLKEEVYMQLPPGFRSGDKNLVCRLRKSLYGLKQAPRCWFAKFRSALIGYGFKQSYSDYSLFTMKKGTAELYVLIYVDDLIVGGNDFKANSDFKAYLGECFHMKDLGSLKYFLGIEVARNKNGIFMSQRKYTLDIITETGLLGAKPATFPIEQHQTLGLAEGPLLPDPERYRRLVGRLIYLLATRPDLTYVIHVLSQFMKSPRTDHMEAALRVVRYLKGTPGQGVVFRSNCDLKIHGWTDSDWSGCPLTRRSVSGWFVTLGDSPISWKTKKQDSVSASSAEAEYRGMANAVRELRWLRRVLTDLGVTHHGPMDLYCDNQAAIYIAANPVFHERTKHVENDCHIVREAVQEGTIVTPKVSSKNQLADILTKALGRRDFEAIVFKLGVCNPHFPT
ncbi:Retrovirus-related Pol polyprotein from transposon RE1 [Cardamine amara subsp. amara]|uniref:Retrovirus-related Pol polyprotein from transposon RE1 n=1 Tax=Cardamine amara subsp. amara TaxID=228776 RepID=A0ABD1A387_CARAN